MELLLRLELAEHAIDSYRERVRSFYFSVLMSKFCCPQCEGPFQLVGPSIARCNCGAEFDPTVTFQRSCCCGAILVKRHSHYACCACDNLVPSIFLFDEVIFNSGYFRDRMRLSREQRRREQAEMRAILTVAKSGQLPLPDRFDLDDIPGLETDIDRLIGVEDTDRAIQKRVTSLNIDDYRLHIVGLLGTELLFSTIEPLIPETRRDKVYRFISLIFMEQDREVRLSQYGEDILVERR